MTLPPVCRHTSRRASSEFRSAILITRRFPATQQKPVLGGAKHYPDDPESLPLFGFLLPRAVELENAGAGLAILALGALCAPPAADFVILTGGHSQRSIRRWSRAGPRHVD